MSRASGYTKRRPSPLETLPQPPSSTISLGSQLSSTSLAPSDSPSNIRRTTTPASPTYNSRPTFSRLSSGVGSAVVGAPSGATTRKRAGTNTTAKSYSSRIGPFSSKSKANAGLFTPGNGVRPDDLDLLAISDPDVLFKNYTVREVRLLENKAHEGAAKKQEELRQMVGERYRDLLGAADSIVRMKSGSEQLLTRLETTKSHCSAAALGQSSLQNGRSDTTKVAIPSTQYTLATLIKLLLDLPTHIWHALEAYNFLSAARLDSLGRIVYRELVSGRWDESGETAEGEVLAAFPVVEKQWEVLTQLGPQIIRRAKAFLKRPTIAGTSDGSITAEELSSWSIHLVHTLAAVIILENISVPEALNLLLDSRKSTLKGVYSAIRIQRNDPNRHPLVDPKGPAKATTVTGSDLLCQAVSIMVIALNQVGQLFGERHSTSIREVGDSGTLIDLLKELQRATSSSAIESHTAALAKSRKRLSAIRSHIRAISDIAGETSPETLTPLLLLLPNALQAARYLPRTIIDFTPFIDITSTRNSFEASATTDSVQGIAEAWLTDGRQEFLSLLQDILADVTSVQQLISIRTTLCKAMAVPTTLRTQLQVHVEQWSNDLAREWQSALERRFLTLHNNRLGLLYSTTLAKANQLATLPTTQYSSFTIIGQRDPLSFLFQQQSLPRLTLSRGSTNLSNANDEAFDKFMTIVKDKVQGRYLPQETIVNEMQVLARGLRQDLEAWQSTSWNEASEKNEKRKGSEILLGTVQSLCDQILLGLSDFLAPGRQPTLSSDRQVAIGSLALAIRCSSTLIDDLSLGTGNESLVTSFQSGLEKIADVSLQTWMEEISLASVELFHGQRTSHQATTPQSSIADHPQLSEGAYAAIRYLNDELSSLGPHRHRLTPSIRNRVLDQFIDGLDHANGHSRDDDDQQLCWDMKVLKKLARLASKTDTIQTTHNQTVAPSTSDIKSNDGDDDLSVSSYIQRLQSLVTPLLASTEIGVMLPLGPPPPVEFRGIVGMVKPGARFTLLSVGSD